MLRWRSDLSRRRNLITAVKVSTPCSPCLLAPQWPPRSPTSWPQRLITLVRRHCTYQRSGQWCLHVFRTSLDRARGSQDGTVTWYPRVIRLRHQQPRRCGGRRHVGKMVLHCQGHVVSRLLAKSLRGGETASGLLTFIVFLARAWRGGDASKFPSWGPGALAELSGQRRRLLKSGGAWSDVCERPAGWLS